MLILYKLYLSYKGLQLTKKTGELFSYPCSSVFSQGLWYNFQSFSKLNNRILLKAWTTLIIKKFILSLRIYLDIYKNTCSLIVILSGISLYTCTCRKNHMTKVEIFLEVHNWIYLKIYKKWITLIRIFCTTDSQNKTYFSIATDLFSQLYFCGTCSWHHSGILDMHKENNSNMLSPLPIN